MIFYVNLFFNHLVYIKEQRQKEQYNNIAMANQHNLENSPSLGIIQQLFFDNLKTIFNSYTSFLVNLEREKKSKLNALNRIQSDLNEVRLINYDLLLILEF
jgi:hypothetical protein